MSRDFLPDHDEANDPPYDYERDDPEDFFPSSKTFGFCLAFVITAFTLAVFAAQILKFLY
jgi:hypothetical protein